MPIADILNDIGFTGSNLLSGMFGAIIGGLIAGLYVGWQTRELARHNLRAIIIKMGVYVQQCKGMTDGKGDYGRTEPWTVYMDEAIACYLRYRAISLPWNRSALDRAWTQFQSNDPAGPAPYLRAPMTAFDKCTNSLLKNPKSRVRGDLSAHV